MSDVKLHLQSPAFRDGNRFSCNLCDIKSCDERLILIHIGKNHQIGIFFYKNIQEKPRENNCIVVYVYIFCLFSTASKPHAQRYITQDKFQEYSCDKCNGKFENWSALKNHKNTEEYVKFGPKNNPCTLCPMKYCTKDLLSQHVANHVSMENSQVKYLFSSRCRKTFH